MSIEQVELACGLVVARTDSRMPEPRAWFIKPIPKVA